MSIAKSWSVIIVSPILIHITDWNSISRNKSCGSRKISKDNRRSVINRNRKGANSNRS